MVINADDSVRKKKYFMYLLLKCHRQNKENKHAKIIEKKNKYYLLACCLWQFHANVAFTGRPSFSYRAQYYHFGLLQLSWKILWVTFFSRSTFFFANIKERFWQRPNQTKKKKRIYCKLFYLHNSSKCYLSCM